MVKPSFLSLKIPLVCKKSLGIFVFKNIFKKDSDFLKVVCYNQYTSCISYPRNKEETMKYKWIYNSVNPLLLKEYREHGFSDILSRVLINRNVEINDYETIKNGVEMKLTEYANGIVNMKQAAVMLLDEIQQPDTHVFVFGDYDADGITSCAIAKTMLESIFDSYLLEKDHVHVHVPERADGYGMNMKWCEEVVGNKTDNDNYLVITFDNGISKVKEVEFLKEHGVKVIITDHHEPEAVLPDCIVVDPKKDPLRFGEELCGAGIAYLFFKTVVEFIDESHPLDISKLYMKLDEAQCLAAIGTVADMMNMTVFNLALTADGLDLINKGLFEPVNALKKLFNLKEITSKDIGFSIAAAINACGQMGKAKLAFELFSETDDDKITEIADEIYRLYSKNKNLTKKFKDDVQVKIDEGLFKDNKICIHVVKDVPHGIAGKLAQNISNLTGKPALVLVDDGEDIIKGSGRVGDSTVDLLSVLQPFVKKKHFRYANGHKAACGVAVTREHLGEIQGELDEYVAKLEAEGKIAMPEAKPLVIDKIVPINDLNEATYKDLNNLPYSMNFTHPNLMIDGEIIGMKRSKSNPNNVCYTLRDKGTGKALDIWAWNLYPNTYNPDVHKELKIVGNLNRNFMSPNNFTLDIIDMKFA